MTALADGLAAAFEAAVTGFAADEGSSQKPTDPLFYKLLEWLTVCCCAGGGG